MQSTSFRVLEGWDYRYSHPFEESRRSLRSNVDKSSNEKSSAATLA